jgi:hypothetical protein
MAVVYWCTYKKATGAIVKNGHCDKKDWSLQEAHAEADEGIMLTDVPVLPARQKVDISKDPPVIVAK